MIPLVRKLVGVIKILDITPWARFCLLIVLLAEMTEHVGKIVEHHLSGSTQLSDQMDHFVGT